MMRRGRAEGVSAVVFSVAVCLAGLWWTVEALPKTAGEQPDSAGVLAFLPSLAGAVLGGWGTWAGVRALQAQRTALVIAEGFASLVVRVEGAQYRQLLGSGPAAPDGRIDLAFSASATGVGGSRGTGTLEGVADYYRSLRPGRLIVTGTPSAGRGERGEGDAGTGKTVLVLSLILGLAAERSPTDPVPVRLTAASWPGSNVRDWLRTHLRDVYRLPRREAALLVDSDLVLPVIDGLDEMDPGTAPGYTSRAADLLRSINRFERGGAHCPVVVSCRHAHYQSLVEAEAEPRVVAHISVARVDPSRAHSYLSQRVAGTERGHTRWRPVLSALNSAAVGPACAVPPEHTLLAEMLDTPWRLTLAATVFEERTDDGRYLRDPAHLLDLTRGGHLYQYLLDHYISAAVSAHHQDSGETSRPPTIGPRSRLDADATWRRLAFLARYLNDNHGPVDGAPRLAAGRALSSTDLVIHELWPLGGKHRTRLTERVLAVVASLPLLILLGQSQGDMLGEILVWPLFLCFAVLYRPAWPKPRRIDLGRLRTHVGRRAFVRYCAAGFVFGLLVSLGLTVFWNGPSNLWEDLWTHQDTLVVGVALGLTIGPLLGLARGLMIKHEHVGVVPRQLIRMDLTAAVIFGPVTAIWVVIGPEFGRRIAHDVLFGNEMGAISYESLFFGGLMIGCFLFMLPVAGGSASMRYFALLLHTRRKLPWRLGRFLDTCYDHGILRMSGTAWQFRHRELQAHLAAHPAPPPRA